MNKYIITHEKIKMQNREEQDFIVAALYNQDKKMIEVSLTPPMRNNTAFIDAMTEDWNRFLSVVNKPQKGRRSSITSK